jgi:hypothetical protein
VILWLSRFLVCALFVLTINYLAAPENSLRLHLGVFKGMSTVRWEPRGILHRRQAPCRKERRSGPNLSAPLIEQSPGLQECGTELALMGEGGVANGILQ